MSRADSLAEYNKKRDFKKTAEPAGKRATSESGTAQEEDVPTLPGGGARAPYRGLVVERDGALRRKERSRGS